ncbi:hypothetical protein NPX13_g7726 [Xylaria arbuscula]|uniref:Uncharacterized protein n=1 Tax=Xylaria arbuscula TaxID=114810 RepID=A0A9W8TKW5_9PEZI|nr:hypothetical protein NPX13_g7726 [Xylaria arbuscula]
MGALNLRKGVHLMHADIKTVILNEPKQLLRIARELLPRSNISEQRRPHQADVLRRQARNSHGRDGARGIAERDQTTLERDTLEAEIEGGLAHTVEDGNAPLATG